MKRINTCFVILLCLFSFQQIYAQQEIPFESSFNYIIEPCPRNDTVNIKTVSGWYAYYTLDDTYNGSVDSNYCIDLNIDATSGHIAIPYSELDTSRSLFVRAKFDDENKIEMYNDSFVWIQIDSLVHNEFLKLGTTCPSGFCTGIKVGIEIPDSTYVSNSMRWYDVPFESMHFGDGYPAGTVNKTFCFASEKFTEQYLRELLFEFNFFFIPDSGSFVLNYPPSIFQFGDYSSYFFYSAINLEYIVNTEGHYEMFLSTLYDEYYGASINTLGLLYGGIEYPAPEHIWLVNVTPSPNLTEQVNIDFVIDSPMTLLAQPFTELIGGFVEGDTIRHNLTIIQEGGNFCLFNYMDYKIAGNDIYEYRSGGLGIQGTTACMRFQEGGTLVVAENATLNYSKNGIGILALHNDGHIELEKNATLNIGAKVFLFRTEANPDENVYINLPAGTTLRFTEGSSIWRMNDGAQNMFINIYMSGGVLDDSGLSEDDKQYIRKIYPAQENTFSDKISIYPNPVQNVATLEMQSDAETSVLVSLTDMNGKVIQTLEATVHGGLTPVYFDLKDIEKGIYILQVEMDGEIAGKKIIKL